MSSIQASTHLVKRFKWLLLSLASFVILLLLGWYIWQRTYFPGTDDAYLNANVVRIAAQIGGPVKRVEVSDHQVVRAGDLLFEIDPEPFNIALQEAEAQLAQSGSDVAAITAAVETVRAQVTLAQANYDEAVKSVRRTRILVQDGTVSKADGDHAEAQLKSTHAAVTAAQAELQQAIVQRGETGHRNAQTRLALARVAQAQLNLSYAQVRSPVDGIVSNFDIRPGNSISSGETLFAVIDTHQWWVDTNFKETDLQRIRPGQPAEITLDMYPDVVLHGEVQSVSPASGAAFSLLPPENATGNWVKVTQRFPVKVRIINPDSSLALRIGASSSVTIDVRDKNPLPTEQP